VDKSNHLKSYMIILPLSMKLPLIGIIKNYNAGGLIPTLLRGSVDSLDWSSACHSPRGACGLSEKGAIQAITQAVDLTSPLGRCLRCGLGRAGAAVLRGQVLGGVVVKPQH
jgi:hypothetical protein